MLAANGPGFTFPDGTGFTPLPDGREPSSDQVVDAILSACKRLNAAEGLSKREVVFAGLGEPLLRLGTLLQTLRALKDHSDVISGTRLNTNGLVPSSSAEGVAKSLKQAGLSRVCVQLQSSDTSQHASLVQPREGLSLEDACALVRAFVAVGMPTECTAIGRPGIDTDAVDRLATELGSQSFKVRPYFP